MKTRTNKFHKTYHVRIKLIAGLIGYFFMSAQEFEDEACTGQFHQTFYGHVRTTYHVLYNPVDFDLSEVWQHIIDYDQNYSKPT